MSLQTILDSTVLLKRPEEKPSYFSTGYSPRLFDEIVGSKYKEPVIRALKKYPVLDIPCGDCNSVYSLLKALFGFEDGIEHDIEYVGIDRYMIEDGIPRDMRTEHASYFTFLTHGIHSNREGFDRIISGVRENITFVAEDALTYLSNFRSKANIIMGGFENDCIIRSRNQMYHEALHEEIKRIVPDDGFFADVGNGFFFKPFDSKVEFLYSERGYLHFKKTHFFGKSNSRKNRDLKK